MENPQTEKGYIRIANEIVDHLVTLHLSGNEWMIVWAVLRKTWGWSKKKDAISLTQFQKLTGLSRPSVADAIIKLVGKRVLLVDKESSVNIYGFNKLYSQWTSREKSTRARVVGKRVLPSREKSTTLVGKRVPELVGKRVPTINNKDTITKDTITKEISTIVDTGFGKPEINELSSYFLKVMKIPKEDCTQKQSRQYWNLLLRESKSGIEGVRWLIDLTSQDEFYRNNITSSQDLYYKRIKIISRRRGKAPKIASWKGETL